jgi:hypothetical protein
MHLCKIYIKSERCHSNQVFFYKIYFFLDDLFCTLMSKLLVLLIPAYSTRMSMPVQALGRTVMYVKPAILNSGVR